MMCEKCIYRKNCQFLFEHKKATVEGCTAFESEAKLKDETIKKFVKQFEKNLKDLQLTLGQFWELQNAIKKTLTEMTEKEGADNA